MINGIFQYESSKFSSTAHIYWKCINFFLGGDRRASEDRPVAECDAGGSAAEPAPTDGEGSPRR